VAAGQNLHPDQRPRAQSPRARTLFRRGAIYGLAGALKAADVAVAAARGAVRGAKQGVASDERAKAPIDGQ
jgi:hypothetical protein